MNIAAYCRVSTDKEDQLNSLEAQKEFFSEYTKRTGDNLVRLYADEGISGTKIKNRKEFLRMMADAEHGLFEMVVVKDISRFARNTVDLLQNVRKLKALGIETQFLTANMTSMGNSEFVLTIFGALAQEESANTSKRVKFGKKMNAEKGRVPNIVYGYDKTIGDYFNLAINEEEAAVVRQIYEWYIKDGYGAAKISIFLNERGLRTKRNCQWSQNGVCRILTNELYTGKIINGKQEVTDFLTGQRADKDASEWMVVNRPDLRIIDPETFEQAQQIMKSRGKAFKVDKERQSNKYLFSTLIKCKECGWSFRRTVRTYKNTYVRWVCSGHNGRGADNCPNAVTVDEDELIEVLQEYFAGLLKAKKNVIRYVVGEFQRVYKAKDENLNYEKELTAQLAKLQKTRQKYMDMYADDLISREELNDKIGGMRKEIERLENELKMVSYHLTKGEQLESVLGQTFKEIEDITDVRQMTNAQLKRIIQKIEVDKDGNVDIYLRLLGDLGLDETVLIRHDETYGRVRAPAPGESAALSGGAGGARYQQSPAPYPGRDRHAEKISCDASLNVKKKKIKWHPQARLGRRALFFHRVDLLCARYRILSSYPIRYERAFTMKTFLLVTSPPASGKTFIAKKLAGMLQNCVYLDKDSVLVLSRRIFQAAGEPFDRSSAFFEQNIRNYEYDAILQIAFEALEFNDCVLVNAPFTREVRNPVWLEEIRQRLAEMGARLQVVWVHTDLAVCRKRMQARNSERDTWKLAHWENYVSSRNFDPPAGISELIVIDNSGSETYLERTQALAHEIGAARKSGPFTSQKI